MVIVVVEVVVVLYSGGDKLFEYFHVFFFFELDVPLAFVHGHSSLSPTSSDAPGQKGDKNHGLKLSPQRVMDANSSTQCHSKALIFFS